MEYDGPLPDTHPDKFGKRYGEKRAFLLSLDPHRGQVFASEHGYTTPSADVVMEETKDIMKGWMVLQATGISSEIETQIEWFLDASLYHSSDPETAMPVEVRRMFEETLRAFSAASILTLARSAMLAIPEAASLVFEEVRIDSTTGEKVDKDTVLTDAIADLETALKSEELPRRPLPPPTGEMQKPPHFDDEDFASFLQGDEDE